MMESFFWCIEFQAAKLKAAAIAPNVDTTLAQLPNRAVPTNPAATAVTVSTNDLFKISTKREPYVTVWFLIFQPPKLKAIAIELIADAVLVALPNLATVESKIRDQGILIKEQTQQT